MSQQAYPLSWPVSWPRTATHQRGDAPFFSVTRRPSSLGNGQTYTTRGKRSMSDSSDEIIREIRAIGAFVGLVVSTNVELRLDGLPYSNRRAPEDPGAAIYFTFKRRPCVLACDKWKRVEDNLWAIAKHLEALRGQERWGVGSVEQAFAGYMALPAPGQTAAAVWYHVLGVPADATLEVVRAAYLAEAKKCHPDKGGSSEAMARLSEAWDQARTALGVR